MKRLLRYARPQTILLLLSIVLMLLVTALDLAIPYLTKVALDDYISPKQQLVYLSSEAYKNEQPKAEDFYFPSILEIF